MTCDGPPPCMRLSHYSCVVKCNNGDYQFRLPKGVDTLVSNFKQVYDQCNANAPCYCSSFQSQFADKYHKLSDKYLCSSKFDKCRKGEEGDSVLDEEEIDD